jgi:hypothetical protein
LYINELQENDYDFWAVTFHDQTGKEINRKDSTEEEIKRYLKNGFVNICRDFLVTETPKSWSVWTHSKTKEWIKQHTGTI